jgi:predicted aspartyl protease
MSPSALLDAWAAALGGRERLSALTTRRHRSRVRMAGLEGTTEEWISGGRYRHALDLGGLIRVERTFDGREAFSRDLNGQVSRLTGPELADAITAAYEASWSHLLPGGMAGTVEVAGPDQLVITPEGGQRVTWTLDPQTHLPLRSERPAQERVAVTEYSEYVPHGGVLFPRVQRTSMGDPRFDTQELLEEVALDLPADDTLFARPAEGTDDVVIGPDEVVCELELNTHHPLVQGTLQGAPVWLLLDTGAGATVLHEATARELGLPLAGQIEGRGAGEGSVVSHLVSDVSLTVGEAGVRGQTVVAVDLGAIEAAAGRRLDGILGYDFLSRFVVTIDYAQRRLRLRARQGYEYTGPGQIVPLTFQNQVPHAHLAVTLPGEARFEGEWLVDTGFGGAISLARPFHEAHGLRERLAREVISEASLGIGGGTRDVLGRLSLVELGGLRFVGPVALLSLDAGGAGASPSSAGLVGGALLSRCVVTFDYARRRMILEPGPDLGAPFPSDGLGISWTTGGRGRWHELTVRRVLVGSPADRAGVRPGDRLLSLDGDGVEAFTVHSLWERTRALPEAADAPTLKLEMSREGQPYTRQIQLEALI